MAKITKKPGGSVNVSLRLDSKTKFLIDLISRSHKRTITGVIEWAVERMAQQETPAFSDGGWSMADIAEMCWSTEEPVRLLQLYKFAAALLTYEEQRIIDTVKNTPALINPSGAIDADLVRLNWNDIKKHAEQHAHEPVAPGVPGDSIIPF